MSFYRKAIDSPSRMSRLSAILGFKKAAASSTSIYIESSRFLKELEAKLKEIEHDYDNSTVLSTAHKFIDRRLSKNFKALILYSEEHTWEETIKLLSTPRLANRTLNEIKEQETQKDENKQKTKSRKFHEPTANEIKRTVRSLRTEEDDFGEESEIS